MPYILIIDEINRANLAKVFGELYFLLEYRDQSISLQHSPDKEFTLPQNLFLIGTMNTADRSIARIDAAMRRRFSFVELDPRLPPVQGLLARWLAVNDLPNEPGFLLDLLNERLADADAAIGPSYLMKSSIYERADGLERVWQYEIMPLLADLFNGQRDLAAHRRHSAGACTAATAARHVVRDRYRDHLPRHRPRARRLGTLGQGGLVIRVNVALGADAIGASVKLAPVHPGLEDRGRAGPVAELFSCAASRSRPGARLGG
jgi:hypothetical protein